ncbi:TonB-dependent receptor [Congregibacter sp.]|nr:TonB-dependent receptor [Congregibacter sp.]MDA8961775.1 TonB-dependent receptor [Congregibacter sp.]
MNKKTTLSVAVAMASFIGTNAALAQLEEVIVTAQKRAQSVQDVPLAISAFNSDELEAMDAKGFRSIVLSTPGLSGSADSDTQSVLTIRGIGTGAFSPGADNSVGTYFNEVPVSRNIGGMGYLDVERVEVVKGPQGTLFGRNTSSGAISVTNSFASLEENSGSLRASAGDEGQLLYEGIANYVVSDSFAVRVAARHDERDGTYQNGVTGDELNGRDHDQVRLGFTWAASDSVLVNAYYENFQMNNRWQMVDNFGVWGNDVFADTINVNGQPEQEIDADLAVLKVSWDINDTLSFTSTTGYYGSDIVAIPTDADTGDVPIVDFIEPWDLEQFTQEFRINGTGDRINWFVGASYYEETARAISSVTIYEDPGLDVLFEDEGLCLVAEDFGLACGVHVENSDAENTTTSYAVYGDVTWDMSDRLALTVGVRYTDEEKDMSLNTPLTDSTTTALIGAVTGGANNAIFNFTPGTISDSESWTSFDPRVALDYKLSDDTLLYASYAKGFKSGGFNRQPTAPGATSILAFDPEENDAYEIGLKAEFLDRRARLNVSLFMYDYTDYQLETNDNASILIQNVADLETSGLEIDATWLISDSFDLRFTYAYLDAEFQKGVIEDDAGGSLDLAGNRALRAPENTYSLAATWNVTETIDARVDYAYVDEMFFTADNSTDLLASDYSLINARLDYNSPSGWGASLIGENLADEEYINAMINFLLPMSAPGYGRAIRAEVRYQF